MMNDKEFVELTQDEIEQYRKYRREYMRRYRKEHPEYKLKEIKRIAKKYKELQQVTQDK